MFSLRKTTCGLLGLALVLAAAPARAAELGKYVPTDADAVAHVNVRQLLGSQLVKKYALPQIEAAIKEKKEVQQVLGLLGLDPLKDITGITVTGAGQDQNKVFLAVSGKFNLEKIQATAEAVARDKKDELKISKTGGKNLYEITKEGKTSYAGFADAGTLVASPSRDYVTDALAGKTGKASKELEDAVAGVDARQSFWAAGVVTAERRRMLASRQESAEFAKSLKAGTVGVIVTDGIAVSLAAQTTDPKAAAKLADLADKGKGILQFFSASNEEARPVIDEILKTLEIKSQKTDVTVKFKLSEEVIEKAIKKLPKQ